MFKVECPGCKAPYQVDERRIPPSGLKMRCPKCGSSFKVDSPSDAGARGGGLGAVLGLNADSVPPAISASAPTSPAMPAAAPVPKTTAGLHNTVLGVAPAAPVRPAAPPPPRARLSSDTTPDLPAPVAARPAADLPAPAAPRKAPAAPARPKPPAPSALKAPPATPSTDADLPAAVPRPSAGKAPARTANPAAKAVTTAAAPAAPAPAAPVAVAPPVVPAPPTFELDLPIVGGATARAPEPAALGESGFGDIELDLPATAPAVRAPAAEPAVAARPALGLDLPSVRGPNHATATAGQTNGALDLPSIPGGPARAPATSAGRSSVDLPALSQAALPDRAGTKGAPGRAEAARGAAAFDEAGLPLVVGGAPDATNGASVALPSVTRADLPAVSGGGLPSVASAVLPSVSHGELPSLGGGLPRSASGGFPAASSPNLPRVDENAAGASLLDLDIPLEQSPARGFGELDLDPIPGTTPAATSAARASAPRIEDALEADPFGEIPLPPPQSIRDPLASRGHTPAPAFIPTPAAAGNPVIRQAGGGTAYGEVDLSGDGASDVVLEAPPPASRRSSPSDEDMEFGEVPQEPTQPRSAKIPLRGASVEAAPTAPVNLRPVQAPVERGKFPIRTAAAVFVLLVGGASLAFVPQAGPFGAYWIIDHVRAKDYQRLLEDTAKAARARLGADTAPDAAAAAKLVAAAHERAKRVKGLTAYEALVASMRELRFGADPEVHARSKVLLDELDAEADVPYLDLARASRAATEGQLARARQGVQAVLAREPKTADARVLGGEVELRARDAKAAIEHWQALSALEPSARAAFGLARARYAAADYAGAERDAKSALERNRDHIGAKILLARIASQSREREPEALEWLKQVQASAERASAEERVAAATLLGDIHLARSRISRAEAAYTDALKINPKAARSLIGLGEALYRAGRYSEAQARFEAGSQADPDDVLAKVGVAKCKLMLERLEDANASLKRLRESHPDSLLVNYWYGRVLEAQGDRKQAEQVYKKAIAKTKSDPNLGDVYIALAQQRMPRSSAIHVALGEVALTQGRYAESASEFRKANELDPEDLLAKFRLGVALRKDGKREEAGKAFEQVAAVDPEFPGLSLERGLLEEDEGRTEEALKEYEHALSKAPNDPDLMLRVGCGYAVAGRVKEAEQLLRKVLALRPTSAETNHCLGRALLAEGSRLADALRSLERAVELDPHRADYHLYAGWAANDAGNVPKAAKELDQAIALDQGLADAYWQRGVLRQRQGAVRDAVSDLTRALTLRPTRYEAHAALAEAYYDLGREPLALSEWDKAVTAQPDNATWHFRYGRLLDENHMAEAARTHLARALELADKQEAGERWAWEAHLRLARLIGPRAEAIPHWEFFLAKGPLDSPYRAEAQATLDRLNRQFHNEGARPAASGRPSSAP